MAFTITLPEGRRRQMTESGLWQDVRLGDVFAAAVADNPDGIAVTGINSSTGEETRLTYAELSRRVDRIALGLVALGVGPGDVVSFQLPNWWQFGALAAACARIGAVSNPLMPIFRQRELRLMLRFAESKVVVVPRTFRDFDHAGMLRGLLAEMEAGPRLFVVGGEGEESFEGFFLDRTWEEEQDAAGIFAERRPDADALAQLMFTSGTSGEPKAVMHTSNTIVSSAREYARWIGLTGEDRVFMASPLAHQTGFIYGVVLSWLLKTRLALQDIWSAPTAAHTIAAEGATFTMASTPFLSDLANNEAVTPEVMRTLRIFVCAGAPIPPEIVRRATGRLGFSVLSCWGMTENGGVTITRPGDPPEKVFETDGKAIDGMEVRVVGADGRPLPPGETGDLMVRGMANFVGYLKRPELNDTDAQGWFRTGDLARMDADGYIRITGRSKDVIIRGGENIPVVEIENVLYRHPGVMEAAIVAMPDPRLVERACAFVVPRPGHAIDLDGIRDFLKAEGVARNYWPERIEIVEAMPRTASGKIQKFRLREIASDFAGEAGA
ncbi:MAG: AMP-binding protein [Aquamicrobium sp.]|nr:AMP-binding protein [Aquamicrobium sp.]